MFLQGFDNVLYKVFTLFWQGFYEVFLGFYKDCTRLSIVFNRLLQGFCKASTRCLQCVLQGFYKAFTKLFTRFLQCVILDSIESVDAMKSTGILFLGRSPVYTSRFVSDLRHISENTFKDFGIPHPAVGLYLYLFMENTQEVGR